MKRYPWADLTGELGPPQAATRSISQQLTQLRGRVNCLETSVNFLEHTLLTDVQRKILLEDVAEVLRLSYQIGCL